VRRDRPSAAARIVAIYVAVSVAWILLSDEFAARLVTDPEAQTVVQNYKGIAFVLLSGALIYSLVRAHSARVDAAAQRQQEAYDQTLVGWAAALDLRDHSTAEHTLRVTSWTVALARSLGIDGDDLVAVRRGALLHDIGKMGVPDAVLSKPGPLTDDEWALMRRHPQLAVEFLGGIDYLRDSLDIPAHHHERWDGTGYPAGLRGEEIPRAARLFAVVDVYDAVTSQRPYREPLSTPDAVALLEAGSGSHFDPEVLRAFVDLLERTGGRLPAEEALP